MLGVPHGSEERCSMARGAVREDSRVAVHAQCRANDDGGYVVRRLFLQECARVCRAVRMVGWVAYVADGVWQPLLLLLQWRSWVLLQ